MVSFTYIIAATALSTTVIAGPAVAIISTLAGSVKVRGESNIIARDAPTTLETQFSSCMASMKSTHKPVVKPDGAIINIEGLSPECMTQITAFNALPNIADLQKTQGVTKITGADSVSLTNVPDATVKILEGQQ